MFELVITMCTNKKVFLEIRCFIYDFFFFAGTVFCCIFPTDIGTGSVDFVLKIPILKDDSM